MLRSMTGFARATAKADNTAVTVTLKSVNHRFLDVHMRLPAEVEFLEPKVRQRLRKRVARGHVDVMVSLEHESAVEVRFDHALVRGYLEAFRRLREELKLAASPDLNSLLKIPGVVSVAPGAARPEEGIEELLLKALDQALAELDRMRADEAAALVSELRARATRLEQAAERIESLRRGADRQFFERLRERINELLGQAADRDRIALEAAILVDRSDVSEEIVRLHSHVRQFLEALDGAGGEEAGKRLDFLLQEMNREANTILSKTSGQGQVGLEITDMAIKAKADIEKLREQVQNLQ